MPCGATSLLLAECMTARWSYPPPPPPPTPTQITPFSFPILGHCVVTPHSAIPLATLHNQELPYRCR